MSIPVPVVPKYDVVLPVSKKKVQYRPFLVREEKILLMASGNIQEMELAVKQVLENCTFNAIDVGSLPMADVELLFIKIRARSIAETIDSTVECNKCKTKIGYTIELDKTAVVNNVTTNDVKIDDNIIVTMGYPTLDMSMGSVGEPLIVTAELIQMITMGENVFEGRDFTTDQRVEWLNNLTKHQLDKLTEYLNTLPKLVYDDHIKCTCGNPIHVHMEGISDFFGL